MRTVILICCAGLGLAACQRTGVAPPARRAGLWLQTLTQDGGSSGPGAIGPVQVCVDATSEAKNPIFNYAAAVKQATERHCGAPSATRDLDGTYRFASTCTLPGGNGTAAIKGAVTGDLTTVFHMRMQTDTTRPPPFAAASAHHVLEVDGKWLGPCPADLAPGDMFANGVKLPGGRMVNPHHPTSSAP